MDFIEDCHKLNYIDEQRALEIMRSFPRGRPILPTVYARLYEEEYRLNRKGLTFLSRLVAGLESWMHRQVSGASKAGDRLLEIGGGTLNHVPYEPDCIYDVVEPFEALYRDSASLNRVNRMYSCLKDVPIDSRYDRIFSIAVLEHVDDLPFYFAKMGVLLERNGVGQHAIPSEGAFLWGLGWRCTTGISYYLRNGLPYGPLMRWEHINSAKEIELLARYFYSDIHVKRFPVSLFHFSFYSYLELRNPRVERCTSFLQSRSVSSQNIAPTN